MSKNQIYQLLSIVLTKGDMNRINVQDETANIQVEVDVHGLKCCQAKRFINNLINIIRAEFRLIVIHGYNHGTAIKDMLANSFINSHVVEMYSDIYNKGVTYIQVA